MADDTTEMFHYVKYEESVFVKNVLQKSQGVIRIKLDFGAISGNGAADTPQDDNTENYSDISKEFETNGTFTIAN